MHSGSKHDLVRDGTLCDEYVFALKAGQVYTIDHIGGGFTPYVRLEDPKGVRLGEGAYSTGGANAHIVFQVPTDGAYRVIATTVSVGSTGNYTLQIRQGSFDSRGLATPHFAGRPPLTGGGLLGGMPAPTVPKADEKREQSLLLSAINDLQKQQRDVRVAAFNNLAGSVSNDLARGTPKKSPSTCS